MMLIKILFYIPFHCINFCTLLLPKSMFKYVYKPATEEERVQSEYLQNKYRKIIYKMNKCINTE